MEINYEKKSLLNKKFYYDPEKSTDLSFLSEEELIEIEKEEAEIGEKTKTGKSLIQQMYDEDPLQEIEIISTKEPDQFQKVRLKDLPFFKK